MKTGGWMARRRQARETLRGVTQRAAAKGGYSPEETRKVTAGLARPLRRTKMYDIFTEAINAGVSPSVLQKMWFPTPREVAKVVVRTQVKQFSEERAMRTKAIKILLPLFDERLAESEIAGGDIARVEARIQGQLFEEVLKSPYFDEGTKATVEKALKKRKELSSGACRIRLKRP